MRKEAITSVAARREDNFIGEKNMKRRDLLKLTATLPFIGVSKIFAKESEIREIPAITDITLTVIFAKEEDIITGWGEKYSLPKGNFYFLRFKELKDQNFVFWSKNNTRAYAIEICIPKRDLKKDLEELREFNKNNKNIRYVTVEYKGEYGLMSFDSTEKQIVDEEILS